MLSTIRITLESEEKITYQKSSLFHGVLMEKLDAPYADELHEQGLKPYSQYVLLNRDKCIWQIHTLNKRAYENIILPVLKEDFQSVELKHDSCKVNLKEKTLTVSSYQSLVDTYYLGTGSRYIHIRFVTPTSFKRDGSYVIYPDISLIYRSLMSKYDAFAEGQSMQSEEALKDLTDYSSIIRYDLKSMAYYLEGVKIPSFIGTVVIKINGPQALVNLAHLLFRYGEFSGIGIKTALGMGAIQVVEREDKQ